MNKELAIKILSGETLGTNEQTEEAVKMAVEALSAQQYIRCPEHINQFTLSQIKYENTFCGKDCEIAKAYGDCFHCFGSSISKRDKEIEKSAQRWIPVTKRLPTKEEYIANNGLFIVSDGDRTYAEYFDVYNSFKYFGEPTMNGFRVDKCVTAWMPLPEPWKGENND